MCIENENNPNPYQSPLTDIASPVPTKSGPQLAGRLNRLGAQIIDGIVLMLFGMPLLFLTGYFQRVATTGQASMVEQLLSSIMFFVVFLVIQGYLLATRGQTVGKYLAKIRIVDYQTNQLLPAGKLIGLRYVVLWVLNPIPFIGGLVALINILLIFGQERRCGHDLIAGTKVVDVQ